MKFAINDIVEKLKNINFDNFDLSKIDLAAYRASLMKRKDIALDIVIILITIFAARYLLFYSQTKTTSLNTALAQLEEKQKVVRTLEVENEKFDALASKIPPGLTTETEIIKNVLTLAEAKGVNVIDYAPAKPETTDYFITQSVEFTFESTYDQMMSLLSSIEQYDKNLHLQSFAKGMERGYSQNMPNTKEENNVFRWRAFIRSTVIKND